MLELRVDASGVCSQIVADVDCPLEPTRTSMLETLYSMVMLYNEWLAQNLSYNAVRRHNAHVRLDSQPKLKMNHCTEVNVYVSE